MISHLKRRIGVLTAVAVLAALVPTLSVSPASAAVSTTALLITEGSTYSACPTGSAGAAGFTDTTSTDVDCIKMHGITTGVTATTYEPSSSIPRWQMALYLTRAATSMGHTLGSGADQGFTDIGGYSAAIQTAINQIKQLTVTTGTTATTYSPDDNVTREQMAMFIERLLGLTTPGPGGTTLLTKVGTATATYTYTDIDSGSVTFEGHNAIVELLHLGVTGDIGALGETYRPTADMTRAEMATFMTNALGHSNARPEGLWLQLNKATGFDGYTATAHISHRDASRNVIVGTLVDVFQYTVSLGLPSQAAFGATGACVAANVTERSGGGTACAINLADNATNASGNIAPTLGASAIATTDHVVAWTGATGALYNNITAPGKDVLTAPKRPAASVSCSDDLGLVRQVDGTEGGKMVAYGTTVTITCQLKDAVTPVAGNVAQPLVPFTISESRTLDGDNGTTLANAAGATLESAKTTVMYTDATGAVVYTVTPSADPDPLTGSRDERTIAVVLFDSAVGSDQTHRVAFNDDVAADWKVSLVGNTAYGSGDNDGSALTGVARTLTATVYDQYGTGMANETVLFESTSSDGDSNSTEAFTDGLTRITNSSGVASLAFTDVQDATGMETLRACTNSADTDCTDADAGQITGTATFYRTESNGAVARSLTEVDSPEAGAIGTAFDVEADDDLWTFTADNAVIAVGNSVELTVVPATNSAAVAYALDTIYYVISVTDVGGTGRTVGVSLTRGGTIHPVSADLGGNTDGVAKLLEDWTTADVIMEIVYWDNANNVLIVSEQSAAANADNAMNYMHVAYDSGDQFSTNGDKALSCGVVAVGLVDCQEDPATLAGFETAVTAKMNILTAYTTPLTTVGMTGDIYHLEMLNHTANGGVSRFILGQ